LKEIQPIIYNELRNLIREIKSYEQDEQDDFINMTIDDINRMETENITNLTTEQLLYNDKIEIIISVLKKLFPTYLNKLESIQLTNILSKIRFGSKFSLEEQINKQKQKTKKQKP